MVSFNSAFLRARRLAICAGMLWCMLSAARLLLSDFGAWAAEGPRFFTTSGIHPFRPSVGALFVLPDEKIPIEVKGAGREDSFVLTGSAGRVTRMGAASWVWQAPSRTGLYPLRVLDGDERERMTLNAFVMIPYGQLKGDFLNGYRIGGYPSPHARKGVSYAPPRGFIEVTRENEHTPVSPNFRIGQFLCKQNGEYPKYIALKENLILKLEHLLEEANQRGFPCTTFTIMSGYRTPYYNRMIGNVAYSRHLWGGAADIFIDHRPRDGVMDDLNRDGKLDGKDAKLLCRMVEDLCDSRSYEPFVGGLGAYEKNEHRGAFIHVDVRGCRARWGI